MFKVENKPFPFLLATEKKYAIERSHKFCMQIIAIIRVYLRTSSHGIHKGKKFILACSLPFEPCLETRNPSQQIDSGMYEQQIFTNYG